MTEGVIVSLYFIIGFVLACGAFLWHYITDTDDDAFILAIALFALVFFVWPGCILFGGLAALGRFIKTNWKSNWKGVSKIK